MLGYLTMKKFQFKNSFIQFLKEEKGAADIVAVILIMLVAVAAAYMFKEQIIGVIKKLFNGIDGGSLADPVTTRLI